MGSVLSVATLLVVWQTARFYRVSRRSASQSVLWMAPLFLACSGVFSFWAMSGLETPLLTLLTLLAICSYLREEIDTPGKFDAGYVLDQRPDYTLLAYVETIGSNGALTSTQISATALLADLRFAASYAVVPAFAERFQGRGFLLYQRRDTIRP